MKIQTIKKRSEFLAIFKKNISYYSKSTLILAKETPEIYLEDQHKDFCRVGYTVTKKIGNAVVRNKCKRRYREIFRELAPKLAQNNFDYSFLARKEILNKDFSKIKADVEFCLKGIKRKIKNPNESK